MTVTVFETTQAGLPHEAGRITVHPGDETVTYVPHSTLMNNLVERLQARLPDGQRVYSFESPAQWVEALPATLKSSYLWAEVQ